MVQPSLVVLVDSEVLKMTSVTRSPFFYFSVNLASFVGFALVASAIVASSVRKTAEKAAEKSRKSSRESSRENSRVNSPADHVVDC